ncbi:IspD/TarI family cytidylyltransferase [Methanobrevibacter sp.]|uniref:IspD/TarI family cytidylyltransferase n=1 Tax=Methanobrevibacter sp. TaxID=66852 RepID=UPI003866E9CF
MNYVIILAAGFGTRIKNLTIPKQYYEINGIPIIMYTVKKFMDLNCFDYVYLTVDANYKDLMTELLEKHIENYEQIKLVEGGKERIDSICNVIEFIENNNDVSDEDIIVVQDGVRPFVSNEIILNSIECAKKHGTCATSSPVNDTIFQSEDGDTVDNIPVRSTLFCGQSPDAFNLKNFIDMINGLSDEQKRSITGTSDICLFYNVPIKMIKGSNLNFKITTDADLKIAELLLKDMEF